MQRIPSTWSLILQFWNNGRHCTKEIDLQKVIIRCNYSLLQYYHHHHHGPWWGSKTEASYHQSQAAESCRTPVIKSLKLMLMMIRHLHYEDITGHFSSNCKDIAPVGSITKLNKYDKIINDNHHQQHHGMSGIYQHHVFWQLQLKRFNRVLLTVSRWGVIGLSWGTMGKYLMRTHITRKHVTRRHIRGWIFQQSQRKICYFCHHTSIINTEVLLV